LSTENSFAAPTGRLFGTDGVRGVANQYPITCEMALKLARALAHVFRSPSGRHRRILIGKDTRLSGYMLETAMESGICSMGADVMLVGPMPTPAIAFLTRSMRAAAGVVISASHNPYQDNGIKFFSHEGFKLDDEIERQIEELVFDETKLDRAAGPEEIGKAVRIDDAIGRYLVFLKSCLQQRQRTFDGIKVVIDCANGAAYKVGPDVLDELGAEVIALGVEPDGKNINREGGALNPARVRETVLREQADLGVALDGDADRAILVDSKGDVLDGDDVMALMARAMAAKGRLACNTVVATVMSNLGLEKSLSQDGLRLVRTEVGDPAVCREMRANGYNLGGEQSGHIIFMDCSTTGDGLITTLMVLEHLLDSGKPLCELRTMQHFPQVLHNIKVRHRVPFAEMHDVARTIGAVEQRLNGRGRVFVRYSGTEMLARVMVEGEDEKEIETSAREIGATIEKHIGVTGHR
jgi:phosphoglucosamine mutase